MGWRSNGPSAWWELLCGHFIQGNLKVKVKSKNKIGIGTCLNKCNAKVDDDNPPFVKLRTKEKIPHNEELFVEWRTKEIIPHNGKANTFYKGNKNKIKCSNKI